MQDSVIQFVIKEAKTRILWTFLCFVLTCIFCYWRSEDFFFLLSKPFLKVSKTTFFICTQLTESLNTYLMISASISCFFCIPLILYQIWSFFIPSCNVKQRSLYNKFLLLSLFIFLFVLTVTFTLLLPFIWLFLSKISQSFTESQLLTINLQLKIYDFHHLTLRFLLIAAFCSQIPIILLYLIQVNLLSLQNVITARKPFFFFSVLFASLVTPPDIWIQSFISLFIFVCIELTILILLIQFEYKHRAYFSGKTNSYDKKKTNQK